MPRTPKYNRNWISSPGASLKHICKKRASNQHQENETKTLHFLGDARMRILYTFCRSKSPAQLFVTFSLNVMKLEYTTCIMVWTPSRMWKRFMHQKYTVFVARKIQNRLAARCFDDDCLWTSSENDNHLSRAHVARQTTTSVVSDDKKVPAARRFWQKS